MHEDDFIVSVTANASDVATNDYEAATSGGEMHMKEKALARFFLKGAVHIIGRTRYQIKLPPDSALQFECMLSVSAPGVYDLRQRLSIGYTVPHNLFIKIPLSNERAPVISVQQA